MNVLMLILLSVIEIGFVVFSIVRKTDRKQWLFGRLLITAICYLIKRGRTEDPKKTAAKVCSGLIGVMMVVNGLIPSFLITGYEGLPATGQYQVGQTQAILVVSSRAFPI